MLRTCSSCKQVWIIKFSIIKKRNIYERVGVTNSANLTRDVETKIHRFESHRGKHSKKDYLTSVCLKLKIKWTWCLIAKLKLHKIIIIYVPSIFSHLFEHPLPSSSVYLVIGLIYFFLTIHFLINFDHNVPNSNQFIKFSSPFLQCKKWNGAN